MPKKVKSDVRLVRMTTKSLAAVYELSKANRRGTHYLVAKHWGGVIDLAQGILEQQRFCVVCGCSDFQACPGGCTWVMVHRATPTGVCSKCWDVFIGDVDAGSIMHGGTFQKVGKKS